MGRVITFHVVDKEEVWRQLPDGYARALRLRDQGLGEAAIANSLGIPPAAVRPLLSIAEAKVARLLAEESAERRLQAEGEDSENGNDAPNGTTEAFPGHQP